MPDFEKVAKGLECCEHISGDYCRQCPYHEDIMAETSPCCSAYLAYDALVLLKAQEQFMHWLASLVTHEDGEGAECEIICRRLHKMGYVEKYNENDEKYWRAVKRDV